MFHRKAKVILIFNPSAVFFCIKALVHPCGQHPMFAQDFGWAENAADVFICWRHRQIKALTAVSVVEWSDWKNKQGFSCPDFNTAEMHMLTDARQWRAERSKESNELQGLPSLPVQNGKLKVKSLFTLPAVYLPLFLQHQPSISRPCWPEAWLVPLPPQFMLNPHGAQILMIIQVP